MNWKEAEKALFASLTNIYSEGEASSIASIIIEDISQLSRQDRMLASSTELSTEQTDILEQYKVRLMRHEPVQYILNKAWFYGMQLYVNNDVLIPRPETEELVQWIIDDVKKSDKDVFIRRASEADVTTELKIMDVCTGSGCIALALKKTMPKAEVWGCDISEKALNVARRNGSLLNIRVDFQGLDFLDEAQQRSLPTVDIIVSNPPYVPENEKATIMSNVLHYEPHLALFVPENDALLFYKALAQFGRQRLYDNGSMYMEIHEGLAQQVADLFNQQGYNNISVKKDMQGKERMVKVVKNGGE